MYADGKSPAVSLSKIRPLRFDLLRVLLLLLASSLKYSRMSEIVGLAIRSDESVSPFPTLGPVIAQVLWAAGRIPENTCKQ